MERLILRLDEHPWHAVYRVAIGFVIIPTWRFLFEDRAPGWSLIALFFATLLGLRIFPMFLRKALPFSSNARATWAARRERARKYDSYQWQKLFWIGLGLALNALLSREDEGGGQLLTMGCLIAGAAGVAAWHRRSATLK